VLDREVLSSCIVLILLEGRGATPAPPARFPIVPVLSVDTFSSSGVRGCGYYLKNSEEGAGALRIRYKIGRFKVLSWTCSYKTNSNLDILIVI